MRKYENNNLIGYQPCYELNGKTPHIEWYKFVYSIKVMVCRFSILGNIIRLGNWNENTFVDSIQIRIKFRIVY